MKKEKISLIIPTFNEKEGIKNTLITLSNSMAKNNLDYEIVVVDDNSKDGTVQIVKSLISKNKRIKILMRSKNPGFGYSLIDGSKSASGKIIIWVMGDSSDNFDTIPVMIKKINEGYDMVIGSRNVSGGSRGKQNRLKAFGSKQYSALAKVLFRLPIYDITNAFRAFRKELIDKIELENGNFAVSPEFAIKAHVRGYKLAEVPTTYKDREVGEAKTKLFRMGLFYYKMLLKYWIKNLFNKL